MKIRIAGVIAGLALLAPAVPSVAAGPANVSVRVEGVEQTLVPRMRVTTTTAAVNKSGTPGETCSGTSAAGALEVATAGDWSGSWFGSGFGYSVERILAETHAFPDPQYFSFWLNEQEQPVGVCGVELQEGDRVLIYVDRCDYDPEAQACSNPRVLPLGLKLPARVAPGVPFTAEVVEYAIDGTASPAAGATVTGADAPAVTDAQGRAAVRLSGRGEAALRATKPNRARTATEAVCASDGADGFCGTVRPGEPPAPAPAQPAATCATTGDDGLCGTRDRRPAQARILGITEQQRFTAAGAPRELRGSVSADPSGLHAVKLRLTRRHRGRCWYLSKKADGFARTRCGRAFPLRIGDRADWSYLLPERLLPGRYVLDVLVTDGAFNRDPLARGRNRVVFTVS